VKSLMQKLMSNRISAQSGYEILSISPSSEAALLCNTFWMHILIICLTFYENLRDASEDLRSRSAYNLSQLESV
jgi:hypothetical protein